MFRFSCTTRPPAGTEQLTFFIAGLPYFWCFEHVDNLGPYSIPSETGLLIPSGFDSHVPRGARFPSSQQAIPANTR